MDPVKSPPRPAAPRPILEEILERLDEMDTKLDVLQSTTADNTDNLETILQKLEDIEFNQEYPGLEE